MCSEASAPWAIEAKGLSKAYWMYPTPQHRLRQAVQPRLARALRRLGIPAEEKRFFAEHWALRDLSFTVRKGETLAVIGRNGAGKSTLLQLLCGTLTPTTGEVRVQGRVAALLELGSGFNPEYTGRENVLMNAAVLGLSREQAEARMDAILAFADIGGFVDQPVKAYSSGMAMRLAFAVIAHVDAEVLIVDEALAVGDAYFQQKCLRWLRGFQQRGTVLFCGHDMGAVLGLCERAIWLDAGRLRLHGPAKQVVEAYNSFVAAEAMGLPAAAPAAAAAAAPAAQDIPQLPPAGGQDYGSGQARLTGVALADAGGRLLTVAEGGQEVCVIVAAQALAALEGVIIGFVLKDRLGQAVLSQNTFAATLAVPVNAAPGQRLRAELRFVMPPLATGEYTLGAAIASGTQANHVQHHFVHEAMVLSIHTPGTIDALLTVPLLGVSLR